jgi:hypothetical protein
MLSQQRLGLIVCLAAVVAGVLGTLLLGAADPPTSTIRETEVLMRAKLSSSQKVLEGLLAEDFTLIAHGAREMRRISEAAEWPRARDTVYEHYAAEFRRQCIKLESLANKTNHEGASFAYLHMTSTCIDCHDYVRDALRVADQPNGGVQLIPAHLPVPEN